MFTATQLVLHAVGDYVIQSDWMANNKTKAHLPAVCHAVTYILPFLLITQSVPALLVMAGTHLVIDRWRLARFVVAFKTMLLGPWEHGWKTDYLDMTTGAPRGTPPFIAVWVMIIVDNVMHVVINALCLKYL